MFEDCDAKLEWADEHIGILADQIDAHLQSEVITVVESEEAAGGRIYKISPNTPIPKKLKIGIGQVVAAQRDALDYLCVALAIRNGATNTKKVYFPFAGSEADFNTTGTDNKIKDLAAADQAKIKALRPFPGGNDMLAALNGFCNKAKHREPLAIFDQSKMSEMGFTGNGIIRRWAVYAADNSLFPGEPFVWLDADPGITMKFAFQLALKEPDWGYTRPVIATLKSFSDEVRGVIAQF